MAFFTFYTGHLTIEGYRGTWTIHYTKAHKKRFGPEQQLLFSELLISTILNCKERSTERSSKMSVVRLSTLQFCTFEVSALTVPLNFTSIFIFHSYTFNNLFNVSWNHSGSTLWSWSLWQRGGGRSILSTCLCGSLEACTIQGNQCFCSILYVFQKQQQTHSTLFNSSE